MSTTSPEQNCDFGRYLKAQRHAQQIPLEDVSKETKIRIALLQQVENEDIASLPGPTFTKGFIRAYAEAVGADVQGALQRYEAAISAKCSKADAEHFPESPNHFWRRTLPVGILFVLLIAVAIFVGDFFDQQEAPPTAQPSSEMGLPAITQPEQVPSPHSEADALADKTGQEQDLPPAVPEKQISSIDTAEAVDAATSEAPEAADTVLEEHSEQVLSSPDNRVMTDEDSIAQPVAEDHVSEAVSDKVLVLKIVATELTWLKVMWDDTGSKELMLKPDEQVTFKANKSYKLLVGNAAGVRLTLDDQPVEISGPSGKVVSLKLP